MERSRKVTNWHKTREFRFFRFISFLFILLVKPRTLRKANLVTVLLAKNPNGEKTKKEVSVLDVGGKLQRIIPEKTLRSQAGTENPNPHTVPPPGRI